MKDHIEEDQDREKEERIKRDVIKQNKWIKQRNEIINQREIKKRRHQNLYKKAKVRE